jgi:hypothetical protein
MKQRELIKKLENAGFVFERLGGKADETGISNIHL